MSAAGTVADKFFLVLIKKALQLIAHVLSLGFFVSQERSRRERFTVDMDGKKPQNSLFPLRTPRFVTDFRSFLHAFYRSLPPVFNCNVLHCDQNQI